MPHTTTDHTVTVRHLAEMYCLFQVDPHDAEIAASQRDHGERTGLMLACRKTRRRLAIVAHSFRAKGPQLAQALERDGVDSSVLLELINRVNDGPSGAAKALECAEALRVQLRRGVAVEPVDEAEELPPSRLKALASLHRALDRNPELRGRRMKEIHAWLKEHDPGPDDLNEEYELPRLSTWCRCIRDAKQRLAGPTNTSRAARSPVRSRGLP